MTTASKSILYKKHDEYSIDSDVLLWLCLLSRPFPPKKATLAKISSFGNNPSQTTWLEAKLFFFSNFYSAKILDSLYLLLPKARVLHTLSLISHQ